MMSVSIGSSTTHAQTSQAAVNTQPPVTNRHDRDGIQNSSKTKQVEPPKATSGSIGTHINTTA
jgi:hypothetical protein